MTDGERFKKLREKLKLSQAQAARICSVTVQSVSNWETGGRRPPGAMIKLLQILESVESDDWIDRDTLHKILKQDLTRKRGTPKGKEDWTQ